jgi:hypothetical protein
MSQKADSEDSDCFHEINVTREEFPFISMSSPFLAVAMCCGMLGVDDKQV